MVEVQADLVMELLKSKSESTKILQTNFEETTHASKVLTQEEVDEVIYGLPFHDHSAQREEFIEFVKEILATITTGDDEIDMTAIEKFANIISKQQGTPVEEIIVNLVNMRKEYFKFVKDGMSSELALRGLADKVLTGVFLTAKAGFLEMRGAGAVAALSTHGMMTGVGLAGGAVAGPLAWTITGIFFLAQTGLNYRKLKRREITQEEFKKRAIIGGIASVSSIAGSSLGAAGGFLIGTAIFPGVGSIVGTIVGGIVGGLTFRIGTVFTARHIDEIIQSNKVK